MQDLQVPKSHYELFCFIRKQKPDSVRYDFEKIAQNAEVDKNEAEVRPEAAPKVGSAPKIANFTRKTKSDYCKRPLAKWSSLGKK